MDIHEYFGVLRRGWALVVLGLLVGIAGGLAANAVQPRSYAATSREILTNSEATGDLTQSLQASNLASGRISSYVLVATSGLVLQPVIDELKLDMTVEQLASHVSVVAPANTLIVEITATAATPELAKSIANSVSAVFSDVIENQIENAIAPAVGADDAADGAAADPDAAAAPVRIVNIEHAALPTAPTFSNAPLLLAVGAIMGLALGLVGASLRESLDRRVRGRKDIAAVTDRPVLGQIRPDGSVSSSPIVMHTSSQSAIAESFRGLRASVEHVRSRDEVNTFVITAMAPRQGASVVAANLALAIADTATSVVVVDANLQAPHQAEIFNVDAGPGLTDLLTTTISVDEVISSGPSENIWVVPIGSRRAKSADLLATARMRALITELQDRFDVVIIDTPAISTATDAAVLGSFGAATLLVVAEGTATRPALTEAINALAAGGSIPAGIVLNQIPRHTRGRRPAPAAATGTTRRVRAATPTPFAPAPASPTRPVSSPVVVAEPAVVAAPVVAVQVPVTPEVPVAPAAAPVDVVLAPLVAPEPIIEVPAPAPVERVLEIAPRALPVESTSGRAAAKAARVAAKAAARAAASRPAEPVSRFAPKPITPDPFELAAAAERRSWPSPIDSVPVIAPVEEDSDSVIDVPRGDTGERVSLIAPVLTVPQPGDLTPEELAEVVANQYKDDVVYEIPLETFGSFHLVDADALSAVDNEPTILPPFSHTEPETAPGTLVIDPVDPLEAGALFTVAPTLDSVHLSEEDAAFVIDLLADEPVFNQPRFEDWVATAATAPVDDQPVLDEPAYGEPVFEQPAFGETEPEFDSSVYDLTDRGEAEQSALEEPTAEEPAAAEPALEEPVFRGRYAAPVDDIPMVELPVLDLRTPADRTVPHEFVAPAAWPAPRLVGPVDEERADDDTMPPASRLARVTQLPSAVSRERLARESYMLKSRELERAAQERLNYEQERLEARIREQLEADRRQLAGKLDELLEDTVMMPRKVDHGA